LYGSRKYPYSSDGWAYKIPNNYVKRNSEELSQNFLRGGWVLRKKKHLRRGGYVIFRNHSFTMIKN